MNAILLVAVWAHLGPGILSSYPPDIRQLFEHSQINRCGPLSLQACANSLGVPVGERDIAEYLPKDGAETSFRELISAANNLGLATAAIQWADRPVMLHRAPAILAVKLKGLPHFVAAVATRGDQVLIIDFPDAAWMDLEVLRNEYYWDGKALHIARSELSIVRLHGLLYWRYIAAGLFSFLTVCIVAKRRKLLRRAILVLVQKNARRAKATAFISIGGAFLVLATGCNAESVGHGNRHTSIRIEPDLLVMSITEGMDDRDELEGAFRIVNGGTEVAQIQRIDAGCGCTSVGEPSIKRIQPGEVACVPFTVQPPTTGVKRTRINVVVDVDSEVQTLSAALLLRGSPIEAPVIVRLPEEVVLRYGASGEAGTTVRVRTYENVNASPWIREAKADHSAVSIRLLKVKEDASADPGIAVRVYSFALEARQNEAAQSTPDRTAQDIICVRLFGDDSDAALSQFYVRIERWRPFVLVPRMVFIEQERGVEKTEGKTVERKIRVIFREEDFAPNRIDATSNVPWLKVKEIVTDQSECGKEAQVVIAVTPSPLPCKDADRGSVAVKAIGNDAKTFEESVPVVLRIR